MINSESEMLVGKTVSYLETNGETVEGKIALVDYAVDKNGESVLVNWDDGMKSLINIHSKYIVKIN